MSVTVGTIGQFEYYADSDQGQIIIQDTHGLAGEIIVKAWGVALEQVSEAAINRVFKYWHGLIELAVCHDDDIAALYELLFSKTFAELLKEADQPESGNTIALGGLYLLENARRIQDWDGCLF